MQEQRLAQLNPELGLRDEALFLVRVRRVVAVEVQAAFADRYAGRIPGQFAQSIDGLSIEILRMMRMHARGERQSERRCLLALLDGGTRDDNGLDARLPGARQHVVQVGGE